MMTGESQDVFQGDRSPTALECGESPLDEPLEPVEVGSIWGHVATDVDRSATGYLS